MSNEIIWKCKRFEELTIHELYSILNLRNEVFVVEQKGIYVDTDNKDYTVYHFLGYLKNSANDDVTDQNMIENKNVLVAYSRILPAGVSYPNVSIGRICCNKDYRKEGYGKELVKKSIEMCEVLFGNNVVIQIGAQLYLKRFYESFGFIQSGDLYIKVGIEHIEMTRQNT
eukprot:gene14613-19622_t